VEAFDEADNVSYRSVAVGNALKDITKLQLPMGQPLKDLMISSG
jgi:hypothetical protein